MPKLEFDFSEEPNGDLDTYFEELPEDIVISFSADESEGITISANSKGFLLLAQLFAEIGLRDLEDGWHAHYGFDMRDGGNPDGPELTIAKMNTK